MKIGLATRSEEELTELMNLLGNHSPRHTVQCLITQALNTLKSIPPVKEDNNNAKTQNMPPL